MFRFILAFLFFSQFALTANASSDTEVANEIKVEGQNYLGETIELIACNTKTDITNVRAGPSASKFDKVSQFLNGQPVSVIDRVTNEGGYDYYRVIYPLELAGGARLYDRVGFVYHEALSKQCDTDYDEVVARNTVWPLKLDWAGCDFKVANKEVLDSWAKMTAMDWRTESSSEQVLCEMAKAKSILVKQYLGYYKPDEKEYFLVHMNGCDAQFSIRNDEAKQQIVRSWRYDPVCLEKHKNTNQRAPKNSPNIGVGDLFSFVFGAGVKGLAAISGTTSEELLSGSKDDDPFCYSIDDEDGRYACLGKPHSTENRDARDILLGNCYGLTNQANDNGLREVCVGVSVQSCYSMNNSDHAFACTTCKGSRQWAAVYATGNILTCYP